LPETLTSVVGTGSEGAEEVPSAVKTSVSEIPLTLARTVFVPATLPRVRVLAARPAELVLRAVALNEPPPVRTVNFAVTPTKGIPVPSCTSTINGFANA
jgi:hypothetical protein